MRKRYYALILMALLLLLPVITVEILHARGQRALADAVAAAIASDPALDWAATFPAEADPELVNLWQRFQDELSLANTDDHEWLKQWSRDPYRGDMPDPALIDRLAARHRQLPAILDDPRLPEARRHWGRGMGYHENTCAFGPEIERGDDNPQYGMPIPESWLLMPWVLYQARFGDDPMTWLRRADHFCLTIQHGSLHDAFTLSLVDREVRQAWLANLAAGRVQIDDWRQRPHITPTFAWAGELFLLSSPQHQEVYRPWLGRLFMHMQLADEQAIGVRYMTKMHHYHHALENGTFQPPPFDERDDQERAAQITDPVEFPYHDRDRGPLTVYLMDHCYFIGNFSLNDDFICWWATRQVDQITALMMVDIAQGLPLPASDAEFQQRYSDSISRLPQVLQVTWQSVSENQGYMTFPDDESLDELGVHMSASIMARPNMSKNLPHHQPPAMLAERGVLIGHPRAPGSTLWPKRWITLPLPPGVQPAPRPEPPQRPHLGRPRATTTTTDVSE